MLSPNQSYLVTSPSSFYPCSWQPSTPASTQAPRGQWPTPLSARPAQPCCGATAAAASLSQLTMAGQQVGPVSAGRSCGHLCLHLVKFQTRNIPQGLHFNLF